MLFKHIFAASQGEGGRHADLSLDNDGQFMKVTTKKGGSAWPRGVALAIFLLACVAAAAYRSGDAPPKDVEVSETPNIAEAAPFLRHSSLLA